MKSFFFAGFILLAFFQVSFLSAEPLYTWTDASGRTFYSSKSRPGAVVATLPEITVDRSKPNVVPQKTCGANGGVNCQAGPDADGSVICYDGFKDSPQRFAFICTAAKLEITDISPLTPEGNFSVFVRNTKSTGATAVEVKFKTDQGQTIPLKGSDQITSLGMEEYSYAATPDVLVAKSPAAGQIIVQCANCP